MSYAGVKSPSTPFEAAARLSSSLKEKFETSTAEMESYVKENLPDLKALKPPAIAFLTSILGNGPDDEGANRIVHAEIDLIEFAALFTSIKLAALAGITIGSKLYQLRVRYFGGIGDTRDPSVGRNSSDLEVVDHIRKFYTAIFSNPEREPVDDCVRRARTLYVTARSIKPVRSLPKRGETKTEEEPVYEETIVSCINFALLGDEGFYVNWLATSNEDVSQKKYGDEVFLLCKAESWQRHQLATFLLKAVNVAVITRLRNVDKLSSKYNIVLQARSTPTDHADRFYLAIGFDEGGYMESVQDLATEVFAGFDKLLEQAQQSFRDYIHFIWGCPDIVVFKNSTGKLSKNKSLSRGYANLFPELTEKKDSSDEYLFQFPFIASRFELMVLATQLEFFYLPFRPGSDMMEFISPLTTGFGRAYTDLTKRDRERFQDKEGWLTDQCIDFLLGWYVQAKFVISLHDSYVIQSPLMSHVVM
jgi:hypothetical protein